MFQQDGIPESFRISGEFDFVLFFLSCASYLLVEIWDASALWRFKEFQIYFNLKLKIILVQATDLNINIREVIIEWVKVVTG